MKQLSGLDAAFLYLETPSTPMHTMAVLLLEQGSPHITTESIQALIAERMHLLPALGQRLREVPLGLDRPFLADDPDFELAHHVSSAGWKRPVTLAELDQAASGLASHLLDRRRPLWQAWFVDGLETGGSALIFKIHHSIIDGVSAAQFMAQILDIEPNRRPDPSVLHSLRRPVDDPIPALPVLTTRALWRQAGQPVRIARTALDLARRAGDLWTESGPGSLGANESRSWPIPRAPRTESDGSLTAQRQVVRGSVPFEDFREIKKAFDTTLNNVLLSACTLALRRHLEVSSGGVPLRPLVSAVPISMRQEDSRIGGNQLSNMLVRLPVQLDRPVEIIRRIESEVERARRVHERLGAELFGPALDSVSPLAGGWLARMHDRFGLANLHPPGCNIVISNIPGPPIPLYCAGVPVRAAFPFGPLMNGTGLNLTVMSYGGRMDFGLIACPSRTPDAIGLMGRFVSAVATLREAAQQLGRH